ncbi:PREDICTED: uncharacterized protein LOC106807789 [Priapulus caudatus]|uniref:Uncharacterized protein LOC106807789 n=1 Tax=Priapulus caudatus TaxID=37621 RepID=A0ABM1E0K7_PRICU|nr:PREDICTED: uncharacterized protein LOC106807789 [Priapulus caudatus]
MGRALALLLVVTAVACVVTVHGCGFSGPDTLNPLSMMDNESTLLVVFRGAERLNFNSYDYNYDGLVSRDEMFYELGIPEIRNPTGRIRLLRLTNEQFIQADRNGDNLLTCVEFRAAPLWSLQHQTNITCDMSDYYVFLQSSVSARLFEFDFYDADHNGELSQSEVIRRTRMERMIDKLNVRRAFMNADTDHNDAVSTNEFTNAEFWRHWNDRHFRLVREIHDALHKFTSYDLNGDGYITEDEVTDTLSVDTEEFLWAFLTADTSGDHLVTCAEFKNAIFWPEDIKHNISCPS